MDRQGKPKVTDALNKFAVTVYVKRLLAAKYRKIILFGSFPHTGAANISEAHNVLKVKEFPSLMALFGKNCKN